MKVPAFVLKTRDEIRKSRAAEHARLMLRKIGETFASFGVIEFFTFNSETFVISIGDITTIITDDKIERIDEEYRVNGRDVAGFKGRYLTIPIEIIEARDRIRQFNEANKKLKPIWKIAGPESPIIFFLKDTGELVVRCGHKEVIATELFSVYGRPAINAEDLELGYPFLQLPVEVETSFLKLNKELALADLHLISVGKSLLDGKEYWKLSTDISDEKWDRVKHYFELFECSGEFSGWLTCEPGIVESALGIKHNSEPDKSISATV